MKRMTTLMCLLALAVLVAGLPCFARPQLEKPQVTELITADRSPVTQTNIEKPFPKGEINAISTSKQKPSIWKQSPQPRSEMMGETPNILTDVNLMVRSSNGKPVVSKSSRIQPAGNNGLGFNLLKSSDENRDFDVTLFGWTGATYYWFDQNGPVSTAQTYSGSYYIPYNEGIEPPLKIMGFTFYNNDATLAWPHVGVFATAGNWPNSGNLPEDLQIADYYGADQNWSLVDLSTHNVFIDNWNDFVVFTALHWSNGCEYLGAGSGCATMIDVAQPHNEQNWGTDDEAATGVYYYPTLEYAEYISFEVMPDTCLQAIDWPLTIPGTVTNHDTAYGTDDYDPNDCGIAKNGNDMVYALTPGANVTVDISLSTVLGGPDLVLLVVDACDPTLNCVAQADAAGVGATETITGLSLTGGTVYYIIVETVGGGGRFSLTVTPTGSAPANDTCGTATDIGSVPYSTSAATYTANDDYDAYCGSVYGSMGGDVVYMYTPAANEYVAVTLTPSDFDGVLYCVTDCGDLTSCVASSDANGEGGIESLNCMLLMASTTYYIIVDGYDGDDYGAFDLDISATSPPANDTCAAAENVPALDVTVSGDTSCAVDDYDGACTGATLAGGDVVYSYTPAETEHVLMALVPNGFDGALYVTTDCSNPAIPTCAGYADYLGANGIEYLCVEMTGLTTYYIIVDGYSVADVGTFDLDLYSADAPVNDTCAAAEAITSLPVAYLGATTCGTDDYDPTASGCTGFDEPGPDVAFSYTATAAGYMSALVNSYYGDVDFSVYIIDNDCSDPVNNCIAGADDGVTGDFEQVTCVPIEAGHTYYIIVDSYSPAEFGVYYLRVWLDQMPTNEDCNTAMAVTSLPFTYDSTTSCAANDLNPASGECAPGGGNGPEVVFSYTPAADETIAAFVDPFYFRTTFYVIANDCSDFSNCLYSTGVGGTSDDDGYVVSTGCFDVTVGNTYYFVVDGWTSVDLGAYYFELRNASVPANEDCATAEDLVLPADVTGDTICAASDFGFDLGGGVTTGIDSGDVVYNIPDFPSGGYVNITFLPDFYADLILVENCETTPAFTLLGYQVPPGYVYRENCMELLSGVDYKLIVDGDTIQDFGTFELLVEEATVPANDTCAGATVISSLPFNGSGATDCAVNDYDPLDYGCASGYAQPGPDVVYSFTPAATTDVTVTVTTTYHDHSVYIVTDCANPDTTCVAGVDDNMAVGDETIEQVTLTGGTTYYIIVDSWSGYQAGPYDITVELWEEPVIPATGPVGLGILIFAISGLLGYGTLRRK